MKGSVTYLFMVLAIASTACKKTTDSPDQAANAFLREVRRENCAKAWTYFSADSQARIRLESERVTREQPYYAEQFSPENLYCKSTYANRYLSYVPGSARLRRSESTNAVVVVDLREASQFLIPGFWPTRYTNRPVEMHMVRENGAWKIDVGAGARRFEAERQERIRQEREKVIRLRASRTNSPADPL